jgi:hypothetical protein
MTPHMADQARMGQAYRHTDPDTSAAAARQASSGAQTLRRRALDALHAAGPRGLTDFELADLLGSIQTSAGKRRGELAAAGLVEWAGVYRLSPHGSPARVWRAVITSELGA